MYALTYTSENKDFPILTRSGIQFFINFQTIRLQMLAYNISKRHNTLIIKQQNKEKSDSKIALFFLIQNGLF